MATLKFFSLKSKKEVWVEHQQSDIENPQERPQSRAKLWTLKTGAKMFKFLSKDDLKLFE